MIQPPDSFGSRTFFCARKNTVTGILSLPETLRLGGFKVDGTGKVDTYLAPNNRICTEYIYI